MAKWISGNIVHIEQQSPSTRRFWVSAATDEPLSFRAGQFITLDLPVHEKRQKRWRSYSIANAPNDENLFELCIVHLEGGLGTDYLFQEVEVGTEVKFKRPSGVFTLPNTIEKDLVFICTGTGVAPFRSMILDLQTHQKPFPNLHLIFGTRHENGILYRDEFEKLAAAMPSFRYDIALSHEADWTGYKGYVHQIYEEKYAKPYPEVAFYLCGWSNMVDEAVANLTEKIGFDKKQVHFELYG